MPPTSEGGVDICVRRIRGDARTKQVSAPDVGLNKPCFLSEPSKAPAVMSGAGGPGPIDAPLSYASEDSPRVPNQVRDSAAEDMTKVIPSEGVLATAGKQPYGASSKKITGNTFFGRSGVSFCSRQASLRSGLSDMDRKRDSNYLQYNRHYTEIADEKQVRIEMDFWINMASGFKRLRRSSVTLKKSMQMAISDALTLPNGLPAAPSPPMELELDGQECDLADHSDDGEDWKDLAAFDCSDQRLDMLLKTWSDNGHLFVTDVSMLLATEYNLYPDRKVLAQGLSIVGTTLHGDDSQDDFSDDDTELPVDVFNIFLQRTLIGGVASRVLEQQQRDAFDRDHCVQLIEYNEESVDAELMVEEMMLLTTPFKLPGREQINTLPVSRWMRTTATHSDRILRIGIKFNLHPIAVSDAIDASKAGATRIDRYYHQYFVSLAIYAFMPPSMKKSSKCEASTRQAEPLKVRNHIYHSVLFLIATGDLEEGHRTWLLSIVNSREDASEDPFAFFPSSFASANCVLDAVYADLECHGRLRGYQADFLLFAVIDRVSKCTNAIFFAYGHRLRWIGRQMTELHLAIPACYINEALEVRLELQELRQWLSQMRGILKTLVADANVSKTDDVPWSYGAQEGGSGKGLLMFLSSTDAHLEQATDRLCIIDELAKSLLERHQRDREGALNNILLTLTIATAVFLPAQLLTGIYGMNFQNPDGSASIPELQMKYGYVGFWCVIVTILASGLLTARVCLKRSGRFG